MPNLYLWSLKLTPSAPVNNGPWYARELNPQHLGRLVLQKGLPGNRTNLGEMPSGIWSESKMTTDMVDLPSQNKRTQNSN